MSAPSESSQVAATVPLIINGQDVITDSLFDIVAPSTKKLLHKSSNADTTHALKAVDAAAKAFESWSQTTPTQKRAIFLKAVEVLDRRGDELREYMMTETGSDYTSSSWNVQLGKECLLDTASRITGVEGSIPTLQDPTAGALIVKGPYGVVLAIAPW